MKRVFLLVVFMLVVFSPIGAPAARIEALRMRSGVLGKEAAREFSGSVVVSTREFRLASERLILFAGGLWETGLASVTEMPGVRIDAGAVRGRGEGVLEWKNGRVVFPATGLSARFATCRQLAPGRLVLEGAILQPPGSLHARVAASLALILQRDGVRCELPGESLFLPVLTSRIVSDLAGRLP